MTNLQPSTPPLGVQPRYSVVAQSLMEDIRSGRYPIGSLLPSEHQLRQQFNVSRHTVREAIRRLHELGFVTRQAGVGTTVKADRLTERYVQSVESISDLFQYVRDVNLKVSKSEDIIADTSTAEFLECKQGQAWLHVEGQRFMEGDTRAIALLDVYIARAYRGIADDLTSNELPIYTLIKQRYGIHTVEVRQQISAIAMKVRVLKNWGWLPEQRACASFAIMSLATVMSLKLRSVCI